jgi:hypothetical protein
MNTIKLNTHTKGLKFKEFGDSAKLDIITSKEQKFTHQQKDTTNGAKRVRVESYKDMALNSVVRLIETNEFKAKRKIDRQERRAFFKAKRMK